MPPDTTPVAVASTVLRLEGRDVLDLLHRLSTRSLTDLEPGAARWALFCDFRGRLLHRALVVRTSDLAVWLLRDDAAGAELAAHVHGHLFREDLRIGVGDTRWSVRPAEGRADLEAGVVHERDGVPEAVGLGGGHALVLAPPDAPAPGIEHQRARITAGSPRHGHEIVPEFHPFEVNLGDEVHLSKGCYTGQEALQRLITYHSVRRRLARVEGEGDAPGVPAPIAAAGGEAAGVLTSAVADSDARRWIGLAVLRNEVLTSGAELRIADGSALTRVEAFEVKEPLGRG